MTTRERDQFLLDAYEEKLAIARSTLIKAQRETAYWGRAIADLKSETAPDYRGEVPALASALVRGADMGERV
ncbi:hypothetical protein [Rhizobium sp. NZLR11]|uniref:hypothetical protein n=1 Tax=Rhizobium sp. NZLR11 TaxID=2731098 RepID=UPI001C83F86F|nr:hypothetical protein [Rhizobium sp. NZLR11]MBX5206728.1 hypothetical protein [Rhizobium sp. NZLR11]